MSAEVGAGADTARRESLFGIYMVFFRIGAFAFGGGLSSWVYREAVERRHWVDEQEFTAGLALSQVLPGTNSTNIAIYLGMGQRGLVGAGIALLGLVTVPFFAALALLAVFEHFTNLGWINPVIDGVTAAALGLLLRTGLRTTVGGSRNIFSLLVLAATFVMVGILQWPLLPVVAGVAPVSVAIAWLRLRHA